MSTMYNPPDGSFVKAIRTTGTGMYTPTEGSQCSLILNTNEAALITSDMGLVTGEETKHTIGEGHTDIHEIIDKCLLTMREDEVCGLMFPMANGRVMKKDDADGNSHFVTMEIHLLNFSRIHMSEMDEMTKLERALYHKERGSELFKYGNKEGAFKKYSQGMKYLLSTGPENSLPPEVKEQYKTLKTQLHLNIAACQLLYENYPAVITNCTCAVDVDLCNVKGFYRRGVAFSRMKDLENAASDLKTVVILDPGNKAALRELHTVHHMLQEEREAQKVGQLAQGMRQMFG